MFDTKHASLLLSLLPKTNQETLVCRAYTYSNPASTLIIFLCITSYLTIHHCNIFLYKGLTFKVDITEQHMLAPRQATLMVDPSSHTVANVAELVLDPLEAVSDTCFKLSLHCQHIIGLDSLLSLEFWIT